jgi:hypothetical protein
VTYRLSTAIGAGALAVLAFTRESQWWHIVGAVLTGIAIADMIVVIAAVWLRRRNDASK